MNQYLSFFLLMLGLTALVSGALARKRIRQSNGALVGQRMATAGLVLGALVTAIYLFFMLAVVANQ